MHGSATGRGGDPGRWMTMDFNPTFYSQFALGFQFLPNGVKSVILLFKLALEYVLSMWTLPLEVYLRYRWGVRALSAIQLCFLVGLGSFGLALGPFASVFLLGAAGLGAWHFVEARRWEVRPRVPWRISYSWGEPIAWRTFLKHLGWSRAEARQIADGPIGFRFLEPATALLGIPLAVIPFTRFLGLILLASGAALFLKRHLIFLRIVETTRDRRDAVAIGEILSETAEAERRGFEDGPAFEVELASPPSWQEVSFAPAGALPAQVIDGPDATGRPKVECPACSAAIRCPADYETRQLKCPKCEAPFVVSVPHELVG